MRKITIGRGKDCDVVIKDTTDVVSRHQAVIAFTFWGKMTIFDTSANGTFVNDERMSKPQSKVISKADKVNFGQVWELDWKMIKDPYRKIKIGIVAVLLLIIVAVLAYLFVPFETFKTNRGIQKENSMVVDSLNTISKEEVVDTVVYEPTSVKSKASNKKNKKKTKVYQKNEIVGDSAMEDLEYSHKKTVENKKSSAVPIIY